MLIILAYILGVFTAYLEAHGSSWGGFAGALAAIGLVMLRLIGGEILHPYTKRFWRGMRKKIPIQTPKYVTHHLEQHPTLSYKRCATCRDL